LAYSLSAARVGAYTGSGIRGTTVASLGCTLSQHPVLVGNKTKPQPSYCRDFEDAVRSAVSSFQPDVAVLMAGTSELSDRRVKGQRLRLGTAERERDLDSELDRFRGLLRVGHVPLVLLTVPCVHPIAANGLPAPDVASDPGQVAWLNQVWMRYAQRHADSVRLVDYESFLCPSAAGPAGRIAWRPDGVSLGSEGALATWRWLAPVAVATVGNAASHRA